MSERERELFELLRTREAEPGPTPDPGAPEAPGRAPEPREVTGGVPRGHLVVSHRAVLTAVGIALALCVLSGFVGSALRGAGGESTVPAASRSDERRDAPPSTGGRYRIQVATTTRERAGEVAAFLRERGLREVAVETAGAAAVVYCGATDRMDDAERLRDGIRNLEFEGRRQFGDAMVVPRR